MKRALLFFCLFFLSLPAAADELTLPKVEKFVTSNGIQVLYIHDDLPRITLSASVCAGYLYEDGSRAGETDILARMLSVSGTAKYPADALDAAVESTGSRFAVRPDWENITVSFQSLDENAPLAFETVSGLLLQPAFSDESFEFARSLLREKIAREGEDPFTAAYARARELIFGKKGYGARATNDSVNGLSRGAVTSLWSQSVKSGNLVIAVSSSRPLSEVKALAEKSFASVPKGGRIDYPAVCPSSEAMKSFGGRIYFITRDIPQSMVVICAPAPGIRDDGAYALRLADEILGGGDFNSKLTREIREKRGLAYSAGSVTRMRRSAGIFVAYSHCDADKTAQTLSLAEQCISETAAGKFSADDLALAKQSIVRGYIFQFDSPLAVLSHYQSLWYNGFDDSYLSAYTSRIEEVSADDLRARFSALSSPGMVRVVIGNAAARASLAGSGEIVDIQDIR